MKRTLLLLCLFQLLVTCAFGQQKFYDDARSYFKNREFEKALAAYNQFYADTTRGKSNYDTYYAAISACKIGKSEEAKKYLAIAIKAGFHYSSYNELLADTVNSCIAGFPEWKKMMSQLKVKSDSVELVLAPIRNSLFDTTLRINSSAISDGSLLKAVRQSKDPIALLENFNNYAKPRKTGFWSLYTIKVDTMSIPFLVYIPLGYTAKSKTPLYVFLHGAVGGKEKFYSDPAGTVNAQKVLLREVVEQGAFIIWPYAKKDFNWLQHQKAFEVVLQEICKVKSLYNIDDNKVYMGGHSDGGAGAFWFALNKPTSFAAAFSLNYFPRVNTGNTLFRNLRNGLPFYGVNGINDTGMPLSYVNPIYNFAKQNGVNWINYTINGDHTLPYDMPDSLNFLYNQLSRQTRNPFPKRIEWETDDVRNGRNAWIAITALDTAKKKEDWHTVLNPILIKDGKEVKLPYNKNKAGAIIAKADGNKIDIQTSCVKRITLYISASMFDLNKQLQLTINNKKFINLKLEISKEDLINEFMETRDRTFIISKKIELTIE